MIKISMNDRKYALEAFKMLLESGTTAKRFATLAEEAGFSIGGSPAQIIYQAKKSLKRNEFLLFGSRDFGRDGRANFIRFLVDWHKKNVDASATPVSVKILAPIQVSPGETEDLNEAVISLMLSRFSKFDRDTTRRLNELVRSLVEINGDLCREALIRHGYAPDFIKQLPI